MSAGATTLIAVFHPYAPPSIPPVGSQTSLHALTPVKRERSR
jgi:hypothetical protein